jgi:23S rRNA (cytidine1920-2'-O)/16S rRNA (cytidine1409-2'-O)-methyltransferase
MIEVEDQVRIRSNPIPWVSRAGLKLDAAIREFGIDLQGTCGVYIGASTGGFTEVLLSHGCNRVVAVDVGTNQLDWKLRSDPRVVSLENFNARNLGLAEVGEPADIVVVDVSFISLEKILPAAIKVLKPGGNLITLIKPQFEVGREKVGSGGIVRSEEDRQEVINRISDFCERIGLRRQGLIKSPIQGQKGNVEYLAWWRPAEA